MAKTGLARQALLLLLAGAVFLAAVWALWGSVGVGASSSVSRFGIDMDPTGNGPRSRVGVATPREACRRVDLNGTIQIDVFVDEVPADRGIAGVQFDLIFNTALVEVSASNFSLLLNQAKRSDPFVAGDSTSTDGSFNAGVIDFGPEGIEPDGTSEIGPGVLARLTLKGKAGAGIGNLALQNIFIQADDNLAVPVQSVLNARVAVNTPCPPDSDGDGVPDDTDLCAATPSSERPVDAGGCSSSQVDPDADGICSPGLVGSFCSGADNCPHWHNPSQALPPWPVPAGDQDCDGWSDSWEASIGTNPLQACGVLAWPPDFNNDTLVNVQDLLEIPPHLGKTASTPGWDPRYDLNANTLVNIEDILAVADFLGRTCTP